MAQTTTTIKTTGMHCNSCAMLIQMTVEELPGVETVKADAAAETTAVTYDADLLTPEQIAEAIRGAGYGAEL